MLYDVLGRVAHQGAFSRLSPLRARACEATSQKRATTRHAPSGDLTRWKAPAEVADLCPAIREWHREGTWAQGRRSGFIEAIYSRVHRGRYQRCRIEAHKDVLTLSDLHASIEFALRRHGGRKRIIRIAGRLA